MWNEAVRPDDTVYHLGDVALGTLTESLPYVGRLNGHKILIPGNHDRVWNHWPHKTPEKRAKFMNMYAEVFESISSTDTMVILLDNKPVMLCHLPFDGDSQEEERYDSIRPKQFREAMPLIHGHIHSSETVRNGRQLHVGMDAWGYRPVHEDIVKGWLNSLD